MTANSIEEAVWEYLSEPRQEHNKELQCPDCGAVLELVASSPLPEDVEIKWVRHVC